MMQKKGGKGLQYSKGEIATLAINSKYKVGIEITCVMVRILAKIGSVSLLL
jgi:hypothetical protein